MARSSHSPPQPVRLMAGVAPAHTFRKSGLPGPRLKPGSLLTAHSFFGGELASLGVAFLSLPDSGPRWQAPVKARCGCSHRIVGQWLRGATRLSAMRRNAQKRPSTSMTAALGLPRLFLITCTRYGQPARPMSGRLAGTTATQPRRCRFTVGTARTGLRWCQNRQIPRQTFQTRPDHSEA
jgi:hypothetical protein